MEKPNQQFYMPLLMIFILHAHSTDSTLHTTYSYSYWLISADEIHMDVDYANIISNINTPVGG